MLKAPFLFLLNAFFWTQPSTKEFICNYTKSPVVIDGMINEWAHARSILLTDPRNRSGSTTLVRTLWDKEYLYLAYEVKDKDLQSVQYVLDHPQLWLDDMIEFLFDTRNDKDSCWNRDDVIYHINLLGQKKDDRGSPECLTNPKWNGNARIVVVLKGTLNDSSDIDEGYTMEIAISWDELEIKPSQGFRMGADFALGDKGISVFDWAGASPFRSPYAFGDLILSGKKKE